MDEYKIVNLAAGIAGGAVMGLKGYLEARKSGEPFKLDFFLKSLFTPLIVGAFAGLFLQTPIEAFTAGYLGKGVQELYSSYTGTTSKKR